MIRAAVAALLLVLAVAPAGAARDVPLAIVGARVVPVSGPEIERGTVVVRGGKIAAVGPAAKVEVPAGAEVVDARGLCLIPGLVDPATTAALPGQGSSQGTTPHRDPVAALDPDSSELVAARRAGYTTLVVLRDGSGIPGTACAIRTAGGSVEEILLTRDVFLRMTAGTGTPAIQALRGPLEAAKKEVEARAKYEKDLAEYRKAAEEHAKKVEAAKKEGKKPPEAPKDLKEPEAPKVKSSTEPLRRAVRGELPVLAAIGSATEFLHFADVTEGFDDLEVVVHFRGGDAGRIVEGLADRKNAIVLAPSLTTLPWTRTLENVPARLAEAGVPFAFTAPRRPEDVFLSLALLVRAGLPREKALAAVTLEPARLAGLDGRVGSIAKGKDANLVLLSGEPLAAKTRVLRVFLEGRTVWSAEDVR